MAVLSMVVLVGLGTAGSPTAASVAVEKPSHTQSLEQPGSVPGGFTSWTALLDMQQRLIQAADRITAATRGNDSGFAGVVAAPQNRELQLFWKGETPTSVKALLSDVRQDVPVSVHRARHSEDELAREVKRLTKAAITGQITSIAPKVDGSGLTATVAGTALTAAHSLLRDATVPVDVETSVTPALATRWDDSPPWHGGGAWRNPTRRSGCSTGFAVWHAGRTKMLTAGHCGQLGDRATDPTSEQIGSVSEDSNAYDVELIDARSAGRVFNNTPSLREGTSPVIGTRNSFVGLWICTSGAFSGTRCGIQVKQTGVAIWVGYWIYNTVRAEQADATNAAGDGDSGGPVEVVASDPTKVYAAGTNTAIDTSTAVSCTGYVTSGRTCARRLYYAPWSSAVSQFGVSIVLG